MKKIPNAPIAKLIGFKLVKLTRGTAICELLAKKKHQNMVGTVHGGVLCDLSDAAMGVAFMSVIGKDQKGVTLEFKINFLRPVFAGEKVRAVAKVVWQGRSVCFLECEMHNDSHTLVAKASSTCKVIR